MILENEDIGLKVEIDVALLDSMYSLSMRHFPKEFGGVLIGRYTEDMKTCIIEDIIPAKEYKSSKYYFERGRRGLSMKLKAYYNRTPRLLYVGEWHTHPDMLAEPSETDKQAMRELEAHDNVNITSPLLLIMSNTKKGYTYNCFVQHNKTIYTYGKQD